MFLKRDLKTFTCRLIQIINCLTPISPFSVDSFQVDIFFSFNKTVNITFIQRLRGSPHSLAFVLFG